VDDRLKMGVDGEDDVSPVDNKVSSNKVPCYDGRDESEGSFSERKGE